MAVDFGPAASGPGDFLSPEIALPYLDPVCTLGLLLVSQLLLKEQVEAVARSVLYNFMSIYLLIISICIAACQAALCG